MNSFAHFLRFYRHKRGLTQAQLAESISTSPQYVSALERQDGEKFPSMKILREIVNCLAWVSDAKLWDLEAARNLTLSGLNLNVPLPISVNIEQELASQAESPIGTAIWIISDTLAESESREFAKRTVEQILERKLRYTYFVPFSSSERYHLEKAVKLLLDEAKRQDMGRERFDEGVAFFQISDCAFSSRLRITNPHGREPTARYSLGARERAHMEFSQAPTELVVKTVNRLSELLSLVEEQEQDESQDRKILESLIGYSSIFGYEELGYIRKVYLKYT